MRSKEPINLRRILLYPTLLFITFIVIGEISAYYYFTHRLAQMFHANTAMTTEVFSKRLSDNIEAQNQIIAHTNDELLTMARVVIQNRAHLSNEYLYQLTQTSAISDIYWYDSTGTVIYDARDLFVGWSKQPGDPIDLFVQSGLNEYAEDIRKSTDEDEYYKFAYKRDSDGYFVQVGIRAEEMLARIDVFSYTNQIHQFAQEYTNVLCLTIIDTSLQVQASTQEELLNIVYQESPQGQKALQGITSHLHVLMPSLNATILQVYTPIYDQGNVIGILIMGYDRSLYLQARQAISLFFTIIALFFIGTYIAFLFSQVVKPLQQFNRYIGALQMDSKTNNLFHPTNDPIAGLYQTVDDLTSRIHQSNLENAALTQELAQLAYTDYLTRLPNRLAFNEVISEKIKQDIPFAVLYIDLDNFKVYNDTKGHSFGDKILLAVSKIIQERVSDRFFAARHGGDEFLIMYQYQTLDELKKLVEELGVLFESGLYVDDELYMLDHSLGVSLYPKDGTEAEDLIRKADVAMYFVKKVQERAFAFYAKTMDEEIEETATIVNTLKVALRNQGFWLVYQPKVNIHTQQITGIEALLRLKDSTLSPAKFIPIAEQSGLIGAIGRMVIRMTIEQIALWKQSMQLRVPVSINISSQQLDDPYLVGFIEGVLNEFSVEASLLSIEITETAIIDQTSRMMQVLKRLKKKGIRIAIDDFGSGQSSINYLTRFEVDEVKLDKAFCDQYLKLETLPIFHAVVHLCKLLGFQVVAEGIETKEQIELLQATYCQHAQGYYYYRPLTVEDLERVYQENKQDDFTYQ